MSTKKQQDKLTTQLLFNCGQTFQKVKDELPANSDEIMAKIPVNVMSRIIYIIENEKAHDYKRVIKYFIKIKLAKEICQH